MIRKVFPCAESSIAPGQWSSSLEQQLLTFKPSWRNELLNRSYEHRGSPLVLLIAASAVQANNLAKQLPTINKVHILFCEHKSRRLTSLKQWQGTRGALKRCERRKQVCFRTKLQAATIETFNSVLGLPIEVSGSPFI